MTNHDCGGFYWEGKNFRMITALPVPSVKVFHKTYYHEKARTGASQPGSPLTDSEAIVALTEKEQPEYFFCGKVKYIIMSFLKMYF